jgi:hypothetical protein
MIPPAEVYAMQTDPHFKMNEARAVQEVFDGEALAINLETGMYYSMPGLSALVWGWLINGVPLGAIGLALNEVCDSDPEAIGVEIDRFVAKLVKQELIVRSNAPPADGKPEGSKAECKMPLSLVLEVFTDMQDLLLLDPIHDVEQAGWPIAKPRSDVAADGSGDNPIT